jgi:hypothetical protein
VIVDATFGGSNAGDDVLGAINLGDHDPRVRGANVRNEELVFSASVDPYFFALVDIVYKIDEEGESAFELEEAYAQMTGLPAGLQVKLGQFLTEFGRTNPTHPHAWEFVNLPVILGRVFGGDGWRGQGARLSWIVPGAPVTVLVGFQNPRGETQASFLDEEGEEIGAHALGERSVRGLGDLAYHARVEASHDWIGGDSVTAALLGFSFATGPNATSTGAATRIYGVDLYVKWHPDATDAGWPFVAWQTEFLYRDYEADAQTIDGMDVAARTYGDRGLYTQIVYAFRRPWTAGVRYDLATSDGAYAGDHRRVSFALTYHTSEFGRIRLQVYYDDAPGAQDVVSVWLNFNFSIGKHGAHRY